MSQHPCMTPGCRHKDEWCDRNRGECDALIRTGPTTARQCAKPTTWLAPLKSNLFPLAYCAEHAPRGST